MSTIVSSIVTGPDGNVWFTDPGANAIGMINPTTHAISLFTIPTASANPQGIAVGPDGNLWFAERGANAIGKINPTTHAISSYTIKNGLGSGPNNIAAGPDGNLWFKNNEEIGDINPTTDAISVFALSPCCYISQGGLTAGPDGNVWFAYAALGEVGKINPTTHAITYFKITGGEDPSPVGIAAGPDGNLWFADQGNSAVGMINPTTDTIAEFATPTANSDPDGITTGPDGNLWFTEEIGKLGSINPTTDATTEYSIPYSGSSPSAITTGPDSNIWFTDPGTDSIGVAVLTTSQLVVATQPPASVTAGTSFGLTVDAENSSGELLSSFDGTVTVALANNPGGATLGGTLTATATNGVATFSNLSLTTADAGYTLAVSGGGFGEGISGAITVTPATASQVVITQQPPAGVTAGSGFGLTAAVEDQYGNVETGDNSDVVTAVLSSNPGGTTLGGTLTAAVSQGVATFSGLTLTKAAAGYTLGVSTTSPGGATSSAITVTPAAATQVVITEQPPASVVVSTGFSLQASVEDAYGNVVTSADNTVKVALDNNPGGAKLGGTVSMKASKGVATFSGLTLSKVGTGYTLELTSSGLTEAVTSPITVTAAGADIALSASAGNTAPDPLLAPLVVDSPDLWDATTLKKRT